MRRPITALVLCQVLWACPDPLAPPPGDRPPSSEAPASTVGTPVVDPRTDTRFVQVRNLLREDPDSQIRARQLYPLIEPVCTSEKERKEFVEVAKWSADFTDDKYHLPMVLARETLEHVATACMRNHPEAAFDLLDRAQATLPKMYHLSVVRARLHAAHGDLEAAEAAARVAIEAGSTHAIALTANIQARRARAAGVGYREGMLDEAIRTVSAEPTAKWPVIDLAAILSTKARLLQERALWEPPEKAKLTRLEAAGVYQRLSVAPFIVAHRRRALDVLCFEAMLVGKDPHNACLRAATRLGDLGAAQAVGLQGMDEARFELPRLAKIEALAKDITTLAPRSLVVLVARGDELELLEWIRPASMVLGKVQQRKPRWIVVDRTSSDRSSALLDRLLELAEVKPELRLSARRDTLMMPCITAIIAGRKTPQACPLDADTVAALTRAAPHRLSILVGRDLDAEIDDHRLYELPTALLSFRESRMSKGVGAWLKSLSDTGILLAPEGFGALTP